MKFVSRNVRNVASATMSVMSAAAQPPPRQMNSSDVPEPRWKQVCLNNDVAHERRSTAATAPYDLLVKVAKRIQNDFNFATMLPHARRSTAATASYESMPSSEATRPLQLCCSWTPQHSRQRTR